MIYSKMGVVAKNKAELLAYLKHITELIEDDIPDHKHYEDGETGFYFRVEEDPCWDFDTPIETHLDMLD